jgi:hypothetical protein
MSALQTLRQLIRIVPSVKTHVCKRLIGNAKPPVGEVGGNRQRHKSFVEHLGILSYKTVAPHAYAAASEAADTTLSPILTPGSLPASTQLITQHQRCQEIFTGNRDALLSSLTPEQAKAVVEASSKLGGAWLTTIPFQPSLRLTDSEVAAALQLRTLAREREAHCTNRGEPNFFGHPEVCLQRKFRRVARHEGAKHIMGQALASTWYPSPT